MNNIGIGIMCFGDDYYFRGTKEKVKEFNSLNYPVYIITDKPNEFPTNNLINVIYYDRQIKSYHDKMLLPKYILENHEICIILDADLHIKDYSFLKKLKVQMEYLLMVFCKKQLLLAYCLGKGQ